MKRKKLMAMLMAVSVFAGVLTGCGNASGQNSGSSEQRQSETTEQTQETSEESDVPEEKEPLKFTMSISNGLNEYIAQSPDINQDKWIKVFNERYNLDLTLKLLDHPRFPPTRTSSAFLPRISYDPEALMSNPGYSAR